MDERHCDMAFDHQPGETCEHCSLEVDKYGNTEADFENCSFPDCGCDGARLCMARNGASTASSRCNIEGMHSMKGAAGREARMNLLAYCHDGTMPPPKMPKVADTPSAAPEVRQAIIKGLKKLPPEWRVTFNQMYSPSDLDRSPEEVVAAMPAAKLDWALEQVQNSLGKAVAHD